MEVVLVLLIIAVCVQLCKCNNKTVNDLIQHYFQQGYYYSEILHTLFTLHGVAISLRQLQRILRRRELYRKGNSSNVNDVIEFIETELNGSSSKIGYRQMHQRCIQGGLRVTRKTVATIIKEFDPEGVELRRRKHLRRRLYFARRPKWVWHIDGYDKLKPYGFNTHSAIDGFSRHNLWLKGIKSNKNSSFVCTQYLECVRCIGGVPRKVLGDHGIENLFVAAARRFLTRFNIDSKNSFKYGKSISNQRTEGLWSSLRRICTNFWINFFRDLVEIGRFSNTNNILYCFGELIEKDLNCFKNSWNNHRIR